MAIQAPAMADIQVSNDYARTPTVSRAGEGLSNFMYKILPELVNEYGDYQKSKSSEYIALGMNDQINDVQRDVSFVHHKAYQQGRDYQAIQTDLALSDTELKQGLVESLDTNPELTLEDALLPYQERNKQQVEAIIQSNLPSNVKEKMLESQVLQHAQQTKTITKEFQNAAIKAEVRGRQARVANLYNNLLDVNMTAEDGIVALQQYALNTQAAYAKRGDLDLDQQDKAFQADMLTAMQNSITLVVNNTEVGADQNIKTLDKLNSIVSTYINEPSKDNIDCTAWVKLNGDIQNAYDKLQSEREELVKVDYTLERVKYDTGAAVYDDNAFNNTQARLDQDYKDGKISPSTYASETQKNADALASYRKSQMDADISGVEILGNGMSVAEYNNIVGKPTDDVKEYNDKITTTYMALAAQSNEPVAITGVKVLQHADKDTDYDNRDLRKKGADILIGSFSSVLRDPNLAGEDGYERMEASYKALQGVYKQYAGTSKVEDLLGANSLNDAERGALERALANGMSLKMATQEVQRAKTIQGDVNAFKQSASTWDVKSLGITAWFGNSSLMGARSTKTGSLFTRNLGENAAPREDIINTQANIIRRVVGEQSASYLAESYGALDGSRVVQEAARKGMIIPSQSGYNAAVVNFPTANKLMSNNAIPESLRSEYNAKALDAVTIKYAKQANVEVSNVFISTQNSGSGMLYVQHLNKSGVLSAPTPIKLDQVQAQATSFYKSAKKESSTKRVVVKAAGSDVKYSTYGAIKRPVKAEDYSWNYKEGAIAGIVPIRTTRGVERVSLPMQAAVPFNGDTTLAIKAINHFSQFEGFSLDYVNVPDKSSGKVSQNIGWQISLTKNPALKAKADAARGNPQKLANLQAEFMASHLKNVQVIARQAGLPVAKVNTAYPKQYEDAQMLIVDVLYHGGEGNGNRKNVTNALLATNVQEGLKHLRSTTSYQSSQNSRKKWMESVVKNHINGKKR